jgi:hypothetical protein
MVERDFSGKLPTLVDIFWLWEVFGHGSAYRKGLFRVGEFSGARGIRARERLGHHRRIFKLNRNFGGFSPGQEVRKTFFGLRWPRVLHNLG